MSEKYLPDNTLFNCNMSVLPSPFRCSGNKKVKVSTAGGLLTKSASGRPLAGTYCKSPAKLVGGVPQPCTCQLTGWKRVSRVCTVEGVPVLTDKSFNLCQFQGKIEVFRCISNKVVTGAAHASTPQGGKAVSHNSGHSGMGMGTFSRSAVVPGGAAASGSLSKGTASFDKGQEKADKQEKSTQKPDADDDILAGMLCSGECPKEQREKCGYFLDHRSRPDSQVSVDNKSQILAENYAAATKDESQRDDIDSLYYALRNRYGTRYWSYAAHHIISGNQVFKQLTELVRLADFLHYDINNAKNCIYLASKEEGYGVVRKDQRNISAYDVMSVSKLQWHVGGHQYSFAKDELPVLRQNIEKARHIPNAEIRPYADLLQEEVADFTAQLRQEQRCWYGENAKEQEPLREHFYQGMNAISQRIRQKLGAFQNRPSDSYPYYVSKEAYRYAFTLPKTGKLMIVRRNADDTLELRKYRISWPLAGNKANPDGLDRLSIKPIGKDGTRAEFILQPLALTSSSRDNQKDCILFCENIAHFLFVDTDFSLRLPFVPPFTRTVQAETFDEVALDEALLASERRQTMLRVWLRDEHFPQYVAPIAMIHQRLEEWSKRNG